MFNTTIDDELELRCGNFPMFKGPVGQRQGHASVRIERYIPPAEEDDNQ